MSYWDVFQSLLAQIEHEDALLIARTEWLLLSQPLLLLAYFFLDQSKLPVAPPFNLHKTLSNVGIVSSIIILSAILAAVKLFVELRTSMFALLSQHPELPMRKLDPVGIGSGLLAPILLSLIFVFFWSLLSLSAKIPALFLTVSCLLFSFFIVVLAHEPPPGVVRTVILGTSLALGLLFLAAAIWLGNRPRHGL